MNDRIIRKANVYTDTMTGLSLHVSTGNTKTGNTPGVNLAPIRSCPGSTAGCRKDCYAIKAMRQYESTRTAWNNNTDLFETLPELGADMLIDWLSRRRTLPESFRWHSSGDILGRDHLRAIVRVAEAFPTVRFFGYTKTREVLPMLSDLPSNLIIRVSMWTDLPVPETTVPLAWYQDGTETRADGIVCPATNGVKVTCDKCRICSHTAKAVTFLSH